MTDYRAPKYWETQPSPYVNAIDDVFDRQPAPATVQEHREQVINLLKLADYHQSDTKACLAAAEVHVRLAELLVAERQAEAAERAAVAAEQTAAELRAVREDTVRFLAEEAARSRRLRRRRRGGAS
ncbi:hypothetical protein ORV05_05420 [Amycolatopsis cynarae]|uniref:Uncharacterized protein n=1 Tax=Amycolatopsis cynarae TaxID=2995223 RepID=A0ABY7B5M4_9PSEU|nr:hypothetical protein [Amycolatopsis sp. HUAS 11-8]WAL67229.1 hypothetical protein ORV05_05420 [Amycolatopsis sp. HUAS 11-8]